MDQAKSGLSETNARGAVMVDKARMTAQNSTLAELSTFLFL